jgi:LuxR family maltose regulon positive regulatory protein
VIDRCPDPGIAGRYLARIESRHSIGARPPPAEQIVEQLTERETAVLRYLPTKMSQREIASELYVSLSTVKTHCAAIYRKLSVGDRKAAVQAARDFHLL